jgi:hypothetical protein
VNVETKDQLKQWMHTQQNKPKNFKPTLSARKLMAAVFCDRKGMIMVEFMQQGTTIMSQVYCKIAKKKKTPTCLGPFRTKGVECSFMTMCVHVQLLTLEHCWSISSGSCLTTLLTSPIFAPSDYFLFIYLKNWLGSQPLNNNEE